MGAIVNALAIVIASSLGMLVKAGIPERITKTVMAGLALSIIVMGVDGAMTTENLTLMIISITLGSFIGEWVDLDRRLNDFARHLEKRLVKSEEGDSKFAEAFVTATLVVCVGSMAIIGSLQSGLQGDHTTLYIKSVLDAIFTFLLASTQGAGVVLSALAVLAYQGGIILLAGFLEPLLSDVIINEIVAVGSLMLIALGLNMLDITKIRVMNMVPAMLIPAVVLSFL
ncbi:MAG: DUF554 domain-containing protein [Atopococcus tabaci]|uniref:DUF554 domain-containing protein n=1 Tax=Atopococcus tabaci TaxID=269774 RepID=A0AA43RNP3_9LACT|nr:DUF554 domain-containing protein [Atopococcus tabaci]